MLEWILGSQTQYGAIDVVAIRHNDGSVHCSPFHIKLPINSKNKNCKIVKVKVNNKETKLSMKVGAAGEAFFIERTQQHEFVSKRFRSSPPGSVKGELIRAIKAEEYPNSDIRTESKDAGDLMTELNNTITFDNTNIESASSINNVKSLSDDHSSLTLASKDDTSIPPSPLGHNVSPTSSGPILNTCTALDENKLLNPTNVGPVWKWKWGDLPIKSTDPFLVDLHTMTSEMIDKKYSGTISPQSYSKPKSMENDALKDVTELNGFDNEGVSVSNNTNNNTGTVMSAQQQSFTIAAASALDSNRILSLCGHILSGIENSPLPVPQTSDELRQVILKFEVSRTQFDSHPHDILSDPSLVVIVNNEILIPWKLAHDYLISVSQQNDNDDAKKDDSLNLVNSSNNNHESESVCLLPYHQWVGKSISNWSQIIQKMNSANNCDSLENGVSSNGGDNVDIINSSGSGCHEDFDVGLVDYVSERSSFIDNTLQLDIGDGDETSSNTADSDNGSSFAGGVSVPWTKESLDWNSVEDFQRLINAFSRLETVPDLLKPYRSITSVANDSGNESKGDVVESSVSTSSDTLNVNIGSNSRVPPISTTVSKDNHPVTEGMDLQVLSLNDISPDDILPGPARGDIYDDTASDTDSYYSLSLDEDETGNPRQIPRRYLYRKSLVPTQDQILSMELIDGQNELSFEIEGAVPVKAHLFMWPEDARIVVADIEGAMFVSNGSSGGSSYLMWPVRSLWGNTQRNETHEGLAEFFNKISNNGYRFLYLTTKPLTHSSSTKDHLLKAKCGDNLQLPIGPVFLPPDTLIQAYGVEKSDYFKSIALKGLNSLFPPAKDSFYAAFGGNERDIRAFERCGISSSRIYIVNKTGESQLMTNISQRRTFKDMGALVNEIFPPIRDETLLKGSTMKVITPLQDSYSDFNYWKIPPPQLDLSTFK